MAYLKRKKFLIVILGLLLFFGAGYLLIFGRALQQQENHIGIALNLPQTILTSKAVKVDGETYLAKNDLAFIDKMEQEGFDFVEQLGSAFSFEKEGKRYWSSGSMYSRYFMVFTQPTEGY